MEAKFAELFSEFATSKVLRRKESLQRELEVLEARKILLDEILALEWQLSGRSSDTRDLIQRVNELAQSSDSEELSKKTAFSLRELRGTKLKIEGEQAELDRLFSKGDQAYLNRPVHEIQQEILIQFLAALQQTAWQGQTLIDYQQTTRDRVGWISQPVSGAVLTTALTLVNPVAGALWLTYCSVKGMLCFLSGITDEIDPFEERNLFLRYESVLSNPLAVFVNEVFFSRKAGKALQRRLLGEFFTPELRRELGVSWGFNRLVNALLRVASAERAMKALVSKSALTADRLLPSAGITTLVHGTRADAVPLKSGDFNLTCAEIVEGLPGVLTPKKD